MNQDTLKKLLDDAKKVKDKEPPATKQDLALELQEVIGTLWGKGMTRKQMLAWLKKRGYTFKDHHLAFALRRYRESCASKFTTIDINYKNEPKPIQAKA